MDYSNYEIYDFSRVSAFNLSTGMKHRSYKKHWHSYGEIILVGSGENQIYQVNQNTYNLVGGDFVLVWPMEMHGIVDAHLNDAMVIQFSSIFMNSLFDLQRIMHCYRNLHVICINSHPELAGKLRVIADKMKEVFLSEQSNKELQCCMFLLEFMMTLDEYREELAPEIKGEGHNGYEDDVRRRMIMVTDYIKNNLTADDLSQATMAQMAGISKDYFSRIFKNLTGMNYTKWLNMIRLEKATEYLAQNDMTLTKIAMLSGFQSIPSFNRVFREEKGMAPGEYRALFVKDNKKAEL